MAEDTTPPGCGKEGHAPGCECRQGGYPPGWLELAEELAVLVRTRLPGVVASIVLTDGKHSLSGFEHNGGEGKWQDPHLGKMMVAAALGTGVSLGELVVGIDNAAMRMMHSGECPGCRIAMVLEDQLYTCPQCRLAARRDCAEGFDA